MEKLFLLTASVVILAGCGSLKYHNVKLVEANEFELCDIAYNGVDEMSKLDARTEMQMRGKDWESATCQYKARDERTRRDASNTPVPMIIHDPNWRDREKAFNKANVKTTGQSEVSADKDVIVVDGDTIKGWLGL